MPRKFFLGRDDEVDFVKADRTNLTTLNGDRTESSTSSGISHLFFGLEETQGIDFGSLPGSGLLQQAVVVLGAETGDAVFLGAPATLEANVMFVGFVSAADEVTVRITKVGGDGLLNPASGDWRIVVLK